MATRGFEFAYMIDGSPAVPVVRDWPVDGSGAYAIGDLLVVESDGQLAKAVGTVTEVTAVCMEARTSGSDGDNLKVAIITPNQVWRCSMDASSTAAKKGYTKTIDVADANTIDADDLADGRMALVDTDTDDDGNVLAYVQFQRCTFGCSAS